MAGIKIGGREIPLLYTTYELVEIQEAIGCTGHQLRDEVFGIHLADENDPSSVVFDCVTDGKKTKKLGTLIRILGNAGLEESGQEPNLTDKSVLRCIRPANILAYAIAVMAVVLDGMKSETSQLIEQESGPVDEVLEAENEKKEPGN